MRLLKEIDRQRSQIERSRKGIGSAPSLDKPYLELAEAYERLHAVADWAQHVLVDDYAFTETGPLVHRLRTALGYDND